jgi:shikimate 5-dehydrogenase
MMEMVLEAMVVAMVEEMVMGMEDTVVDLVTENGEVQEDLQVQDMVIQELALEILEQTQAYLGISLDGVQNLVECGEDPILSD